MSEGTSNEGLRPSTDTPPSSHSACCEKGIHPWKEAGEPFPPVAPTVNT